MAEEGNKKTISRRKFLAGAGAAVLVGATDVLGEAGLKTGVKNQETVESEKKPLIPFAESRGYLVYDSRLCSGCQSCMLACSMANMGEANLTLSRIQIIRNPPGFEKYPYDIDISICRQCATPLCVQNCPSGACHVDHASGNVRRINEEKCIGCRTCLSSCPHQPHRTIWNPVTEKSMKCDLCTNARYFSQKGGPEGKQACVEACGMKALKVVNKVPSQMDVEGYDVELAPSTPTKVMPKPDSHSTGTIGLKSGTIIAMANMVAVMPGKEG